MEINIPNVPGLDAEAFTRFIQYRKVIKKPFKDVSLHAAATKLAGYGDKQAEVVQQTIANGWQGLQPLPATKLAYGEKPVKTEKQKAADDAYWQSSVERAERGWNDRLADPIGRLKMCDALWARYTISPDPDTAERLDWLKGVIALHLREADAKKVLAEPDLMTMVWTFFGPAGARRIKERAGVPV